MTEQEREMDLLIGDLQRENATLKRTLVTASAKITRLEAALERIHALSKVALWPSESSTVVEVVSTKQTT